MIVAVIDIGKTNAKVALVDLASMVEVALRRTANTVSTDGLYPHHDVERLWAFILESLADLHRELHIDAVSITTHGATAVLVDARGRLALPVIDYDSPVSRCWRRTMTRSGRPLPIPGRRACRPA